VVSLVARHRPTVSSEHRGAASRKSTTTTSAAASRSTACNQAQEQTTKLSASATSRTDGEATTAPSRAGSEPIDGCQIVHAKTPPETSFHREWKTAGAYLKSGGYKKIVPAARIVRAAGLRKFLKFSIKNGTFSVIFGNENRWKWLEKALFCTENFKFLMIFRALKT